MADKRLRQLINNIDQLIGEYMNGQSDYGIEEYPNMTFNEWVDYLIPSIYHMKSSGNGSCFYGEDICRHLRFIGNARIKDEIKSCLEEWGLEV